MPDTKTANNWAALIGEWDFSNPPDMRFKGKPYAPPAGVGDNAPEAPHREKSDPSSPTYGVALSDLAFSGGTVEAEFTFDECERSVGELILAYNPQTQEMLTVGIGGGPGAAMFGAREWVKSDDQEPARPMWRQLDAGGDRINMEGGRAYHVRGSVRGSQIGLAVDGIQVISTQRRGIVPNRSQVGLFCGSVGQVTASGFCITAAVPRAFVVTQFSAPFTDVYLDVIKSACEDFGIDAIRADEIYGPGVIVEDIVEQVRIAQLVIADISVENANVYFEMGYALATEKPLILLAKKGTSLPFDVSGFRVLFYEDSIGGKSKVEEGLRNHLRALLGPEVGL